MGPTPAVKIHVTSNLLWAARQNSPYFIDYISDAGNPETAGVFRVGRPMIRQPFVAVADPSLHRLRASLAHAKSDLPEYDGERADESIIKANEADLIDPEANCGIGRINAGN